MNDCNNDEFEAFCNDQVSRRSLPAEPLNSSQQGKFNFNAQSANMQQQLPPTETPTGEHSTHQSQPDIGQFMTTITSLMQQNTEMLGMMQLQQQNFQCNSNIAQHSSLHVVPDYSKTIDKFSGERGPVAGKTVIEKRQPKSIDGLMSILLK